jgi:hypothetical protein
MITNQDEVSGTQYTLVFCQFLPLVSRLRNLKQA